MEGVTVYVVMPQNVMYHLGKEDFILSDEIPILTIELHMRQFQTFHDISMREKLIWK